MSTKANKTVVRDFEEQVWNQRNAGKVGDYFSTKHVFHGPGVTKELRGPSRNDRPFPGRSRTGWRKARIWSLRATRSCSAGPSAAQPGRCFREYRRATK